MLIAAVYANRLLLLLLLLALLAAVRATTAVLCDSGSGSVTCQCNVALWSVALSSSSALHSTHTSWHLASASSHEALHAHATHAYIYMYQSNLQCVSEESQQCDSTSGTK
jgi:hypothetical protein